MISTWGIFWISFFGAIVINTLIKRVIPPKYPKVDKDTYEKLRELVIVFAQNINFNLITQKKSRAKKKEESVAQD